MNTKQDNTKEELNGEEKFFAAAEASGESVESAVEKNRHQADRRGGDGFRREVDDLLKLFPEWKDKLAKGEGLPEEVIAACAKHGTPLRAALAEYEVRQAQCEIERLRRENAILRQNAAAAAKAPVRGAASGSTETKRKDPFLEGLLSED